ncbi:hypothetical protein V9T40_000012 [Parthenolecanium corni]|uniref:beta-lactamase n=1 Tax=Parthenolecanium corni TaxID=536013 RepID=A0AAN9TUS5_9HEMI
MINEFEIVNVELQRCCSMNCDADCKIVISSNSLGKEAILLSIAAELKVNIDVDTQRFLVFEKVGVAHFFSKNSKDARIKASNHLFTVKECEKMLKKDKSCVIILLTAFYKYGPCRIPSKLLKCRRLNIIPFSAHCNHAELKDFVRAVRPQAVFPVLRKNSLKNSNLSCSIIPQSIYDLCAKADEPSLEVDEAIPGADVLDAGVEEPNVRVTEPSTGVEEPGSGFDKKQLKERANWNPIVLIPKLQVSTPQLQVSTPQRQVSPIVIMKVNGSYRSSSSTSSDEKRRPRLPAACSCATDAACPKKVSKTVDSSSSTTPTLSSTTPTLSSTTPTLLSTTPTLLSTTPTLLSTTPTLSSTITSAVNQEQSPKKSTNNTGPSSLVPSSPNARFSSANASAVNLNRRLPFPPRGQLFNVSVIPKKLLNNTHPPMPSSSPHEISRSARNSPAQKERSLAKRKIIELLPEPVPSSSNAKLPSANVLAAQEKPSPIKSPSNAHPPQHIEPRVNVIEPAQPQSPDASCSWASHRAGNENEQCVVYSQKNLVVGETSNSSQVVTAARKVMDEKSLADQTNEPDSDLVQEIPLTLRLENSFVSHIHEKYRSVLLGPCFPRILEKEKRVEEMPPVPNVAITNPKDHPIEECDIEEVVPKMDDIRPCTGSDLSSTEGKNEEMVELDPAGSNMEVDSAPETTSICDVASVPAAIESKSASSPVRTTSYPVDNSSQLLVASPSKRQLCDSIDVDQSDSDECLVVDEYILAKETQPPVRKRLRLNMAYRARMNDRYVNAILYHCTKLHPQELSHLPSYNLDSLSMRHNIYSRSARNGV